MQSAKANENIGVSSFEFSPGLCSIAEMAGAPDVPGPVASKTVTNKLNASLSQSSNFPSSTSAYEPGTPYRICTFGSSATPLAVSSSTPCYLATLYKWREDRADIVLPSLKEITPILPETTLAVQRSDCVKDMQIKVCNNYIV